MNVLSLFTSCVACDILLNPPPISFPHFIPPFYSVAFLFLKK